MKKSGKPPEFKAFPNANKLESSPQHLSPEVLVNQIFHANSQHERFAPSACWMDGDYFCQMSACGVGRARQGFSQPVGFTQRAELMRRTEPGAAAAATPPSMNLHQQPPDGSCPRPAGTRGECCHCGPSQSGSTGPANRDTASVGEEYSSQLQSDEEDLEPPLPLKADDEWQHYNPFVPPHHHMHNYNPHHTMGVRYYHSAGEAQYSFTPSNRYPPQPFPHSAPCQHRGPWEDSQNWPRHHNVFVSDSAPQAGVSVNVPQFCVPPTEGMSQVSVMNLSSTGQEASISHQHERRRTVSLSDVCRNVFVTYSSDVSSEIVPFVDFLTKQGFRPAIDLFDNPIRRMDINKWKDSYLKDPSTLIIIAISPKYKEDIEGSIVDSHSLHTRYIHTMMQNEFIQQGSLNFRFIPVLFLNASQKLIPSWLQNTRSYRWPQDTEDLLLRLLREERYVPPPVPMELTLIIRPVAASSAAIL